MSTPESTCRTISTPRRRAALAGSPSAEVKGRLERLLEIIGEETLTPEQQRDVRYAEFMDVLNTLQAAGFIKIGLGGKRRP